MEKKKNITPFGKAIKQEFLNLGMIVKPKSKIIKEHSINLLQHLKPQKSIKRKLLRLHWKIKNFQSDLPKHN